MDSRVSSSSDHRFQRIDKVALLTSCPLFSRLNRWELTAISRLMRLVEYKKDDVIYKQDTNPDDFYVVVSGRLEASKAVEESKKIFAYYRRGDYFGEISLLTSHPHSTTVVALSDSLLLILDKEHFKQTVEHNATISLELSRRLGARVRGQDNRATTLLRSELIALFSNQQRIGRTSFSVNLAASLVHETRQKVVLLDVAPAGSFIAHKLNIKRKIPMEKFQNIENSPPDSLSGDLVHHPAGFEVLSIAVEGAPKSEKVIIPLLNHLALNYRFIVIDLPTDIDQTVLSALEQSDSIYFVTDSHINNITEIKDILAGLQKNLSFPDDKISIVIHEVFYGVRTTAATQREHFEGKNCYSLPSTPELIEREESRTMPYVVEEPGAEYSRVVRHIARRASNNLVGLALGSGAALGLAHIGVLKVLEKERIPIDIIAGSSIGALIGGVYAIHSRSEDLEKLALQINSISKLLGMLDLNWVPFKGLIRGKRVLKRFAPYIGTKTFEDCRIHFRATGANLSTRQSHIFHTGSLAEAIRTSIAIPAIFKPVILDGDTLVDGGILSPLPVRTLQDAGANKIIAVNVFPTGDHIMEKRLLKDEKHVKEAMRYRQKHLLSQLAFRLRVQLSHFLLPNSFDDLMTTIQAMESEIAEVEGESADVLLRPVVPTASWVDFFKPEAFIQKGEEETKKMLSQIKTLVSQQNV